MNNLIQSECEREIKKVTRTIIILITLNICPIYAGNGLQIQKTLDEAKATSDR